jgi:hypothetical protein
VRSLHGRGGAGRDREGAARPDRRLSALSVPS